MYGQLVFMFVHMDCRKHRILTGPLSLSPRKWCVLVYVYFYYKNYVDIWAQWVWAALHYDLPSLSLAPRTVWTYVYLFAQKWVWIYDSFGKGVSYMCTRGVANTELYSNLNYILNYILWCALSHIRSGDGMFWWMYTLLKKIIQPQARAQEIIKSLYFVCSFTSQSSLSVSVWVCTCVCVFAYMCMKYMYRRAIWIIFRKFTHLSLCPSIYLNLCLPASLSLSIFFCLSLPGIGKE